MCCDEWRLVKICIFGKKVFMVMDCIYIVLELFKEIKYWG